MRTSSAALAVSMASRSGYLLSLVPGIRGAQWKPESIEFVFVESMDDCYLMSRLVLQVDMWAYNLAS